MVEAVYARALLELAEETGKVNDVDSEIAQLQELVAQEPQIMQVLSSRTLSLEERDGVLVKAFQGKVSDLVFRFVRVLVRKTRFNEFPGIAAAFRHFVDQKHGILEVHAFVAQQLDDQSSQRITQRVGELTSRQVRLKQTVQPDMVGGVKIRVGDELIDGSVATQVRLIKEKLIDAGRERARTNIASMLK
jgi:F-type H+-transporting ATPase subunit delta